MDGPNYYIPMTINEIVDGLKGIVDKSEDLTGQELVVGVDYISDNDYNVPPGSIAVYLQQNTIDLHEKKYGTIVLTPGKTTTLM